MIIAQPLPGNLMSPASRLHLRRHDRSILWAKILGVYLTLLITAAVLIAATLRTTIGISEETVITAEEQAARKVDKLDSLKVQLVGLEAKIAADKAIGQHPDWSILLSILAQARGQAINLSLIDLSALNQASTSTLTKTSTASLSTPRPSRYSLRIGGIASDHPALTSFILRLESLGIFDRVALAENNVINSETPLTASSRPRVSFLIQTELDDSPKTTSKAPKEPKP